MSFFIFSASTAEGFLRFYQTDLPLIVFLGDYKSIVIGFVAGEQLKLVERSVSERDIIEFKKQCKDFILALITKIKAKSPLNYSLVRNLQCLDEK